MALVVGLECLASAVVLPAIGLDDDAVAGPKEVGDEGTDPDVDLWQREAVAATEGKKELLELGARAERTVGKDVAPSLAFRRRGWLCEDGRGW